MSEQELRAALQAAQAEAAALRNALEFARMYLPHDKPEQGLMYSETFAPIYAALSGDAGAAYQREHEAMRRVVEAAAGFCNTVAARGMAALVAHGELTELRAALDALSAPAAEPEVQS